MNEAAPIQSLPPVPTDVGANTGAAPVSPGAEGQVQGEAQAAPFEQVFLTAQQAVNAEQRLARGNPELNTQNINIDELLSALDVEAPEIEPDEEREAESENLPGQEVAQTFAEFELARFLNRPGYQAIKAPPSTDLAQNVQTRVVDRLVDQMTSNLLQSDPRAQIEHVAEPARIELERSTNLDRLLRETQASQSVQSDRIAAANTSSGFDLGNSDLSKEGSDAQLEQLLRQTLETADGSRAERHDQAIPRSELAAINPTNLPSQQFDVSGPTRALPELPVQNEAALLRQTNLLVQNGGGQARIQIDPPQLGELNLRVTVTDSSVQLSILADKAPVADLLGRHINELRQALTEQGLHVDRIDVDIRDSGDHADSTARERLIDQQLGLGNNSSRQGSGGDSIADLSHLLTPRYLGMHTLGAVDVRV